VIVVDTSALVGAWHAHYRPTSMGGFWKFLDAAWDAERLVISSIVFDELVEQSGDVHDWVKARKSRIIEPSPDVQRLAGHLLGAYSFKPGRDTADPFVIAEAKTRGYAVATYEGRSPTGTVARARRAVDNMPTICAAENVACLQPGEAWEYAGLLL
jgi:hypothetical protein